MGTQRPFSAAVVAMTGMAALALPMGIGRFALTPILPMMQIDAGVTLGAGGWLASANYLGTLIGALLAMVIRVPLPSAIRAGLLTIGITTLAMGVEHRLPAWIALRLVAGIATGWVLPLASAWSLEQLSRFERPLLNATVFAGYGVGIAAAGAACSALMRANASSAQAWASLGGLSFAVTAVIWPIFQSDGTGSAGKDRDATVRRHRWDAESARLVLCYGVFGFGYIIPATFLPVMARQAIEDPSIFGWAWPGFGVAAAASTFAAAGLSKSLGNRRLWSLGHLVMACGVVLPVVWQGIIPIMLSALLVGATFTVITMAGFQEGRKVGGVSMIAAMAAAFATGQIMGPLTVSSVVHAEVFSEALVGACVLLLASAPFVLGTERRRDDLARYRCR